VNGVVVVTDRRQAEAAGRSLRDTLACALDGGAAGVLLREKDLPRDERARLADDLRAVTAASGAALVVASDVGLALSSGADGVHLASTDRWPDDDVPAGLGVGRSCHTVDDLVAAEQRRAGWATYSPVFATASKPGYGPPLGVDGLAAGCRAVPSLAVLALGGVNADTAGRCVAAGAAGAAVMGAVMGAADPSAVVRALVVAVGRATPARERAER
jgi:thiamine-phosphate pyrophosphorylase